MFSQCPILLFLGYANDFATSLLRLRQRRRSVQVSTSAQYPILRLRSVQVPNAQYPMPNDK
ncbi:hypothetical protein [Nostoc sp.]